MLCILERHGRRPTLAPIKRREFLIAGASAAVPLAAWAIVDTTRVPHPGSSTFPAQNPTPSAPAPTEGPLRTPTPDGWTAQLQARIDALPDTGGTIALEAGRFELDAPIRLTRDQVTIQGAGQGATTLVWSGPGAAIRNSDPSEVRRQTTIRDLTIANQGVDGSAGGIILENLYNTLIDRCRIEAIGATGVGIEFRGTGSTYFNSVRSCWIDCSTEGSTGIRWSAGDAQPNANRVFDTTVSGRGGTTGFDIAAGDTALLMGCAAEGGDLVLRVRTSFAQVIGCRFELGDVVVEGTANTFIGNSYADTVGFDDRGSRTTRIGE